MKNVEADNLKLPNDIRENINNGERDVNRDFNDYNGQ